jgi:hypothetical protein
MKTILKVGLILKTIKGMYTHEFTTWLQRIFFPHWLSAGTDVMELLFP